MEPRFYDIDPNGDTLLTLRNPNAPFLVRTPSTDPPRKRLKLDSANVEQRVQMRLSSTLLMRASAYFKRLMEGNWKETTTGGQYSYTIDTSDFDEEALLILMNIIHGNTAKLPMSVKFETLAKISLLVDYYQCPDMVQFFVKTWLQNMGKDTPTGRDAVYKVCISWVFPDAKLFKSSTRALIKDSKGSFNSLGLPISQPAIGALNGKREAHISAILAAFHGLVEKESTSKVFACSRACSSMCLGALVKSLAQLNIGGSPPPPPYAGHSVSSLDDMIIKLEQLPFEDVCPREMAIGPTVCVALRKVRSIFDKEYLKIKGLELKEFIELPK